MATLRLEVTSSHSPDLGDQRCKTFDERGGSIGRAWDNDWVLPDPSRHISSHHAQILFENQTFFLVDTSTNGVFINGTASPVGKGNRVDLASVSKISIGEYSITPQIEMPLSVAAPAQSQPGDVDTLFDFGNTGLGQNAQATPSSPPPASNATFLETDPLAILGTPAPIVTPQRSSLTTDEDLYREPVAHIDEAFFPDPSHLDTTPPNSSAMIPEDWDATGFGGKVASGLTARPSAPQEHFARPVIASRPPEPALTARPPAAPQPGLDDIGGELLVDVPTPVITPPATPKRVAETAFRVDPTEEVPVITEAMLAAASASPALSTNHTPAPTPPQDALLTPTWSANGNVGAVTTEGGAAMGRFPKAAAAFAAAGLDVRLTDNPELADSWLALMPAILTGLVELLQARATVKNELRASQTILQALENNPLKFSINGADAIHNLFVNPRPGFQPADQAVKHTLEDLKVHQAALLAGVQGGLNALMRRLSPAAIEQLAESNEHSKNLFGKITASSKWELYQETFRRTLEDSSHSFLEVFGEDFVKAYEHHEHEAKNQAH